VSDFGNVIPDDDNRLGYVYNIANDVLSCVCEYLSVDVPELDSASNIHSATNADMVCMLSGFNELLQQTLKQFGKSLQNATEDENSLYTKIEKLWKNIHNLAIYYVTKDTEDIVFLLRNFVDDFWCTLPKEQSTYSFFNEYIQRAVFEYDDDIEQLELIDVYYFAMDLFYRIGDAINLYIFGLLKDKYPDNSSVSTLSDEEKLNKAKELMSSLSITLGKFLERISSKECKTLYCNIIGEDVLYDLSKFVNDLSCINIDSSTSSE